MFFSNAEQILVSVHRDKILQLETLENSQSFINKHEDKHIIKNITECESLQRTLFAIIGHVN